jgi:hypothetical protein
MITFIAESQSQNLFILGSFYPTENIATIVPYIWHFSILQFTFISNPLPERMVQVRLWKYWQFSMNGRVVLYKFRYINSSQNISDTTGTPKLQFVRISAVVFWETIQAQVNGTEKVDKNFSQRRRTLYTWIKHLIEHWFHLMNYNWVLQG